MKCLFYPTNRYTACAYVSARAHALVLPHAVNFDLTNSNAMPSKMDCEEPWEVQLRREFCGSELSLEGVRVHVAETRLGVCFVLVTYKIERTE